MPFKPGVLAGAGQPGSVERRREPSGRGRKLRQRAEFQSVYERGTRFKGRLMTCIALPNDFGRMRLGITATQKLGNAVFRNRAKRRLRELFRGSNYLVGIDLVIIPRRELVSAPWPTLEADYRAVLDRIARLSRPR